MDSLRKVMMFINKNLYLFNDDKYKDYDRNVIKGALAYKYLLSVYLNIKDITVDQILILQNDNIGLIGPGGRENCLVSWLEFICGNRICHTHSILHDSYGRIYQSYSRAGRGYNYMFNAPHFVKKVLTLGMSLDYYTPFTITLDIFVNIKIKIFFNFIP